jgi:hypothetical protein
MSFINDIVNAGSSIIKGFTGSGLAPTLARTAALGLALNQITKSINKDNTKPSASESTRTDRETRVQQSPDTQHSVPVVYGSAFLSGIVTDAALTNDGKTMFFVITVCEKTGVKLSDGQASTFQFNEIYWEGARINLQADGITVASITDEEGNNSTDFAGLIKIYCYAGNSNTPVVPVGYTNGNLSAAYGVMPTWTSFHTMDDLIFVVVRVDYKSEKNLTGLGKMDFKITNSMTLPGDCVDDYMKNTRYGAGIPESEIFRQ